MSAEETVLAGGSGVDSPNPYELAAGTDIGAYRLMQPLPKDAQGGMGEVWIAERRDHYRKKVALKFVRVGVGRDPNEAVARFEEEREILGRLNHPHIAQIFDGGVYKGRPWFAMEFVEGEPITRFCDSNSLDTRTRLRIFRQVCDAIVHAHRTGIIHRDLKPANILVTMDAAGTPQSKVIDFGIAKAMSGRIVDRPFQTAFHEPIGTYEYMSPEQTDPGRYVLDFRTDVYSLGIVLYEILVGARPFDLERRAHEEKVRIIREEDPPTPSLRLSTMSARDPDLARRVSRARREQVENLIGRLRGELEWIPLKAIQKDRDRRYRDVVELAQDVDNYMLGHALVAAPESAAYRLRKLARRNRALVAGTAAVLAALVLGLGLATWQWGEAVRERDRADAEARESAALLDAVASSMNSTDPWELDADPSVAGAMRRLLESIDRPSGAALGPEASFRLRMIAGKVLASATDPAAARLGVGTMRAALDSGEAASFAPGRERLADLANLVSRSAELGMLDGPSDPLVQRLQAMNRRLQGDRPLPDSALAMAAVLQEADPVAALASLDAALGTDDGEGEALEPVDRARLQTIRSNMLARLRRPADAIEAARDAMASIEAVFPAGSAPRAFADNMLGSALFSAGDYVAAEPHVERAATAYAALLGPACPNALQCRWNLASIASRTGRPDRAREINDAVIETARAADDPRLMPTLGMALALRGRMARDAARFDEALAAYEECLVVRLRFTDRSSPWIGGTLDDIALTELRAGRCDRAAPRSSEALAVFRAALPETNPVVGHSARVGARIALCLGRPAEARRLADLSERSQPSLPEGHADRRDHAELLAAIEAADVAP